MLRCIVMIVRKRYASPYRRYKYFNVSEVDLKSRARFVKLIEERAKNWRDSEYFLKEDGGRVLARFELKEGKVVDLFKISPATDQPYACWDYFKN